MASSLSDDEFQRMQSQLLQLRTENYQLDETCQRQEREIVDLRSHVEVLSKELQKSQKVVNKSKKAKEFELLMQETDSLQRKLVSQEEEFRLQNETIMQELQQLVTSNEKLEKETQLLKGGGNLPSALVDTQTHTLQDEVRRLQAQNSALQKNLATHQEKHEEEQVGLRQTISDLEVQCVKLSGQRGTPVGQGSIEGRTVEGHSDQDSVCEDQTDSTPDVTLDSPNTTLDSQSDSSQLNKSNIHIKLDDQAKQINNLSLNLDTELEENKMLKEQLQNMEKDYKDQVKGLQEDVDKLSEKFKKKQESLVKLQEEKEQLYSELSKKLEDTTLAKDTEIQSLREHSQKLQQELELRSQGYASYEQKTSLQIQELEGVIAELEERVDEASEETNQQLTEQNYQFQQQLQEVGLQLQTTSRHTDDLKSQLHESRVAHQAASEELQAAQEDRDHQIRAAQEAHRVAEKRKSLLDELAIKYQQESDQHREAVKKMEEQQKREVQDLTQQLDNFKARSTELEEKKDEVDQLRAELHSLQNTKGWLERRLSELEESLQECKTGYESMLSDANQEHDEVINNLKQDHDQEIQRYEEQIKELETDKEELKGIGEKLTQDIKDGIDDKRIHEKKGLTMLKDLKRQLHQERKRGEKLQERLQELLSDNRSRQSVEELFRPTDPNDRYRGDASSVSSWSASGLSRENTSAQSPDEEMPVGLLEQENTDLMKRLADVQQVKWMLEEKVSHLESSNSCMAEDLLQKTAVIEHYVMDSRIESAAQSPNQERISLKKVMDFMKDKGDENLRDMNKKLQHMLEETLTKNMHLQQDLETLSLEVVRLSKNTAISPLGSPSGEPST